jgi:CHASE3 domain sensor protein
MKAGFSQKRNVLLAFGAVFAAILIAGAISYRGMVVSNAGDRWVAHTHELIETLGHLNFKISEIESTSHAFAMTGNEADLAAFPAYLSVAAQDQAMLRTLTVDNAERQRRLPELEQLISGTIEATTRQVPYDYRRRFGGVR